MTESIGSRSCIVDTDGLYLICTASANLRGVLFDCLSNGTIWVSTWAWNEFREIYPDEAAEFELTPNLPPRLRMNQRYRMGAANIAERLNSGFPRGSHDENVELYTASVSQFDDIPILTSSTQTRVYQHMGCKALTLDEWLAEVGLEAG